MRNPIIPIIILSLFLLGCSEQEFRSKYGQEIRQEVKDVVKEAVKEVLVSNEMIKIEKSSNAIGTCTLANYKCMDFVVNKNSITFQLENTQESNLVITDYLVSDCSSATSNPKVGNYQMFRFDSCNNGDVGSTFDQDIKFIVGGEVVNGHLVGGEMVTGHIKSTIS